MTNHVHLLAVPETETALASAIGEAHRCTTWQLNRRLGATGTLFQGRFAWCPLDPSHLSAAARTVLLNPVRANLAGRAIDSRWSSAVVHTGATSNDPLVERTDLLELLPDKRAWRQWMESDSCARQQESFAASHAHRPPVRQRRFYRQGRTVVWARSETAKARAKI